MTSPKKPISWVGLPEAASSAPPLPKAPDVRSQSTPRGPTPQGRDPLKNKRGKRKAAATLQDLGITINMDEVDRIAAIPSDCSRQELAERVAPGVPMFFALRHKDTARTISDMMANLIKYGSWSEKQVKYIRSLVERFTNFDPKALAKAEKVRKITLAGIKVRDGRQIIEGNIKSIKEADAYSRFPARKMLVLREDGWKFWGSVPSALTDREVKVGDKVSLSATIKVKDVGFGFFSRPSKATVVAVA